MKEQPLVSVFMPTYNHEDFIADALDSVLSQDYENIEIIVGDDASTDKTPQIIREYIQKYPNRIKAIFNPRNLGVTRNCNVILEHCTGEYVAFFSGDDLFLPGKIKKQVEAMGQDQNIILCYHDIEVFHSEMNRTLRFWNRGQCSLATPIVGFAQEVAKAVVLNGTSFMAALSVMVKRTAIPKTGYRELIPVASDWMMWIDILVTAPSNAHVVFLDDVLARYRKHNYNVTNSSELYYSDVLTTLAIVESEYPWLIDQVAENQARLRYDYGIKLIRSSNVVLGRKYLLQSAKVKLFSWEWFGWFFISYVPKIIPKIIPKIQVLRQFLWKLAVSPHKYH